MFTLQKDLNTEYVNVYQYNGLPPNGPRLARLKVKTFGKVFLKNDPP